MRFASLGKLFRFVRPYWLLSLLSLALLSAIVVMDLAIPRLIQRIIDQGIARNDTRLVIVTSLWMLGISLLSMIFAILNNEYSVRVGESVARDLREALFRKILAFSYQNMDRFSTGRLLVRLSSDTAAVQRLTQVSLRIGTRAPLLMIGSLILIVRTSGRLALALLPLLLFTGVMIVVFSLRMEPLFRLMQTKLDRLNTVLQENIAGVRLVKAFVRAAFEGRRFAEANQDYTHHTIHVMRFMTVMQPALTIFVNMGVVAVIWIGGRQVIQGTLSLGQIVAVANYLLTTMTPLIMMTMLSNVWANGAASAQRITEVLDVTPEITAPANPLALFPPGHAAQGVRIAFEQVSFHYAGSGEAGVLQDVNFVAEPGQTVAILGATGVGKTTLIELIPRFYDPTSGRITANDVDLRRLNPDELLTHIAIVPQESILFSGSVADNIRYGRPQAVDEEVEAAAKAAQAHEFILGLPQGYATYVEERGVNLSGGQKQRLAIARALLLRPAILILDDSTSSVDVETETKIHTALARWNPTATIFLVAQRISTVLKADKILVLDNGRVAAIGPHRDLLASSEIYQEIYDSQLGGLEVR